MKRYLAILALACAALALGTIAHADTMNPPPGNAFSAYSGFELRPIQLDSNEARDAGRVKEAAKVQERIGEEFYDDGGGVMPAQFRLGSNDQPVRQGHRHQVLDVIREDVVAPAQSGTN